MTVTTESAGVSTTKLQDYLGRWLTNLTPGSGSATDQLGRNVVTGDKDYIGRSLTFAQPAAWATAHAYSVGDYVTGSTGIFRCTTAGTSGAAPPTWPANGGVDDGTSTPKLHWVKVH